MSHLASKAHFTRKNSKLYRLNSHERNRLKNREEDANYTENHKNCVFFL